MGFQIHAWPVTLLKGLSELDDAGLAERNIKRQTASVSPGYPCRVSLEDAKVGETVYLMNYTHLQEATPYQASHAIFVRAQAQQAHPEPNEIPASLALRVLSLSAFDAEHQMIDAKLGQGSEITEKLDAMLAKAETTYVHLHNAKPGCFAARAIRVD